MDAFIARQPILNRHKEVVGYELLFRSGSENIFGCADGDRATTSLINDAVHLHSIEKLTQGRKCFINFTRKVLIDGLYEMLAPESTIVEILETVELDDELINACRRVRELGYGLALDDYALQPQFEPLLPMIDVLKVEFATLSEPQHLEIVRLARDYGFSLLAEKVETPEQFEHAKQLGYDQFQGYFFCKPQIRRTRRIPSSQMQCLRLLRAVNQPEFDVDGIEEILRTDLTLSYKLLRYLNSPIFQRRASLNSIRQAIVTLGQQPLRQWVSLIAVEELSSDKPLELMNTCLIRARFCENLGYRLFGKASVPDCFITGMFSVLDAILDQPMRELTSELNLNADVRLALVGEASPLLPGLDLVQALEAADWNKIQSLSAALGIEISEVMNLHSEAIEWSAQSQQEVVTA